MRDILLTLCLLYYVSAKSLQKRSNAYGDEPVIPAEIAVDPVVHPYAEQEVAVVPEVPVPHLDTAVERSGYRSKRNTYGDEPIIPDAGVVVETAPVAAYAEEAVPVVGAPVDQPLPFHVPVVQVERSGYRSKRSNAYGDEPVIPVEVGYESAPGGAILAEEAVNSIDQTYFGSHPVVAPVVHSGYRTKRNAYGDELILPAALPPAPVAIPVEIQPVAIEQGYAPRIPYVISSGYRMKKSRF